MKNRCNKTVNGIHLSLKITTVGHTIVHAAGERILCARYNEPKLRDSVKLRNRCHMVLYKTLNRNRRIADEERRDI